MKKIIFNDRFLKTLFCSLIFISYFQNSLYAQISTDDFVTTWKTDNPGSQFNSTSIFIPIWSVSPNVYNYDIDWNNDGVFDEFGKTTNALHDYGVAGTYTIRIRGQFPQLYINDDPDANEKIISVEQWGNISWSSMLAAFSGAKNLVINATDAPDLSKVKSMTFMFKEANSLNQNINHWDVGNVEEMDSMFRDATMFNQPLNNWNVSKVENMVGMFEGTAFNQDISNWNVTNVENMSSMFKFASNFNQPLDSWNVSNVKKMKQMFFEAGSFNQSLNSWNVSNVTDMVQMFFLAKVFNQSLDNWNVTSVTNMQSLFDNAYAFNQPLNNWNVGNVTNMDSMFWGARNFNQSLNNWNVSNVTNMEEMFWGAKKFNEPIGDWDVSKITNMNSMFRNASVFDKPLNTWDVGNVTSMNFMFTGTGLSTKNYDDTLIVWSGLALESSVTFHGGSSTYCNSETARNILINTYGWTIFDAGLDCSSLSVSDFFENRIKLFPNPTNDIVNINTDGIKINNVLLYSMDGKLIKEVTLINNNQINLKDLSSGLYHIKLISNEGISTKKIVKN